MKIGYVSDLHLEFGDFHPKLFDTEGGDILIVAGDLTTAHMLHPRRTDKQAKRVVDLIERMRGNVFQKYDLVLYIMGNHEHYNYIFDKTPITLAEHFKDTNVKLMNNDIIKYQDVTFIGATLWSDYFGGNPISMKDCEWGMNDYRLIYRHDPYEVTYVDRKAANYNPAVSAGFLLAEHDQSRQYIAHQLREHENDKCVVLTHHAPTLKSLNSKHCGNGLDGAYASDLSNMILANPNIKYWVHGHTHSTCEYDVGDTKVISNQCGYKLERCWIDFEGIKHIEV